MISPLASRLPNAAARPSKVPSGVTSSDLNFTGLLYIMVFIALSPAHAPGSHARGAPAAHAHAHAQAQAPPRGTATHAPVASSAPPAAPFVATSRGPPPPSVHDCRPRRCAPT